MHKSAIIGIISVLTLGLGGAATIAHHHPNNNIPPSQAQQTTTTTPVTPTTSTPVNTCDESCMQQAQDSYDQYLSDQTDQANQALDDNQNTTSDGSGCYPLTNGGNCYEPGEYCRKADNGASGVAGNGTSITCTYNDGLRWEPN